MRRTRTFNAAPARTASGTVAVMTSVIADSLTAASGIDTSDLTAALGAAWPALLMLTSGRHLKDTPVVLVAGNTVCDLYCRYDNDAIGGEENLNPVPGMSTADTFRLHLPAPGPLAAAIGAAVAKNKHLTTDLAPAETKKVSASAAGSSPLDLISLRELL